MGKTRQRNHSELEYLRAENKRLKKQLKHATRKEHWYEELVDVIVEEEPKPLEQDICPSCNRGPLLELDLKYVIIYSCKICDYKAKKNPHGKEKTRLEIPANPKTKGSKPLLAPQKKSKR